MQNSIHPIDFQKGQVLFIDKAYKWTSFDVVSKIRSIIRKKYRYRKIKVGHAGTLDPLATGLIIICTGMATKKIREYQSLEKEYIATLLVGKTTPSYDLETEVDSTYPIKHISLELIKKTLPKFTGKIEQVPPEYSAKRLEGQRAYDLAREGKIIRMKPNTVTIKKIELLEYNKPVMVLRIICSKGTYIRALARDLGQALGSGAHLIALKRTRIGRYELAKALNIEKFEEKIKYL